MRLGEYLVDRKDINKRQLDEALHAQLLYGGHLGTCLMELGHLDEFSLGEALAAISDVPYASGDQFAKVRMAVIKTIPTRIVEKHLAVPFEIDGNTLRVAMVEPKNLPALDEISFAAGMPTEAWVAPEARILQVMERYYDIPRRHRIINLCRRLDGEWIHRRPGKSLARSTGNARRAPKGKSAGAIPVAGTTRAAAGPSRRLAMVVTEPAVTDPQPPRAQLRPVEVPPPSVEQEQISELLCRVESVTDVAKVILDDAARGMARSILFLVKGSNAVICGSRGLTLSGDREIAFPIASEPVFSLFLGEGFFRGPLPDGRQFRGFYDKLDMPLPTELMVMPVHIEDRLVALFYGDDRRKTGIQGETAHYRMMLRKCALGMNLVMIRSRIRGL